MSNKEPATFPPRVWLYEPHGMGEPSTFLTDAEYQRMKSNPTIAEFSRPYVPESAVEAARREARAEALLIIQRLLEEDFCCGCGYYDAVDENGEAIMQTCSKCSAEEFIESARAGGEDGK